MTRGSATDFLIRALLDEAFRELAMTDARRAFEGYDLSDEERNILHSQDERVLGLLGKAVTRGEASAEPSERRGPSNTETASLLVLPEVKLLLRLAPHTPQPSEPGSQMTYEASLRPWPGDLTSKGTDAEGGRPIEEPDDGMPPAIEWMIRVTPTVVDSQEAGLKVSYSASIHPFTVGPDRIHASAQEATQALASPPWNHHIASSAAKTAAKAVRVCGAGERYEKLLDLIHDLQTGDASG
ncbi:MAG: hypothetical protein KAV82_06810 [Phycisphaerae bacterium]|nr:hypothetical protein [Phycisphaerae bacterium]